MSRVPSQAMSSEPPAAPSTSTPGPPPSPGPGASRDEWRAWRHRNRDFERDQWAGRGWYGPGPWSWGGGRGGVWGWFWGAALILIGGYYLLTNLGLLNWLNGDVLWPVLVILFGILLLVNRARHDSH
ncbi:MAG: DUF5668 domain-containing protein [Candidatus Dormiibacterota bacterium]